MRVWQSCLMIGLMGLTAATSLNPPYVRLHMTLEHHTLEIGQDDKITFRLTNLGISPMRVFKYCRPGRAECDYRLDIFRSDGLIPEKTIDYDHSPFFAFDTFGDSLGFGESDVDTTSLSMMTRLTEPGTYTLRASRRLPDSLDKNSRVVYSNSVVVTVIGRPADVNR